MSKCYIDSIVLSPREKELLRNILSNPNKEALKKRDLIIREIESYDYRDLDDGGFSITIPKSNLKLKKEMKSMWETTMEISVVGNTRTSYVTSYDANIFNDRVVDVFQESKYGFSNSMSYDSEKKHQTKVCYINDHNPLSA